MLLRKNQILEYVLPVVVLGLLLMFSYTRFYRHHLNLPQGCDQFGYLNLAKAVANGTAFTNPAHRPFEKGLIRHLKESSYPFRSHAWLIAPHAYSLHEETYKIVNQYPPGTSILLSFLPIYYRQVLFPPLSVLLVILLLLFARVLKGRGQALFPCFGSIIVACILMVCLYPPFKHELKSVNSVAPTFGLLIAAGYLLRRRPCWSFFFLGTACAFRVSNMMFFLPFSALYWWPDFSVEEKNFTHYLRKIKTFFLPTVLSGFSVYIIYVWVLLGSPFGTTYASVDTRFTPAAKLIKHIVFYSYLNNRWFIFNVILILCLGILMRLLRLNIRWLMFSITLSVLNYTFFVFHNVMIRYYPYASAVIILGLLIDVVDDHVNLEEYRKFLYAFLVITGFILLFSIHMPGIDAKEHFIRQVQLYRDSFSQYDVVWGSLRTGTVEYATDRAAFRYLWGPQQVRKDVIGWLQKHGYSQAFWVEEQGVKLSAVEQDLKELAIPYQVVHSALGTVVRTAGFRPSSAGAESSVP